MKTTILALLTLFILASCSQNSNEDNPTSQPQFDLSSANYQFKTIGEERDDNIKVVTQIHVMNHANQSLFQTLEGFQAEVQKNEEVIIEDLNFDGHSDIRLMQYLPTDESIAFFYWIYNDATGKFVRSEQLEKNVFSPVVDKDEELLVSQWRKRDGSWGSDFYRFTEALDITLVKQEIHAPIEGTTFKRTIKEFQGDNVLAVRDSTYEMEAYLPF